MGGVAPSTIGSPAKFTICFAPIGPNNATPLAFPKAAAAGVTVWGWAIGNTTDCGVGAAIVLDAGVDGVSIAVSLLSRRSITETTVVSSAFVIWDACPEIQVAGEGDRSIGFELPGSGIAGGEDGIGMKSEG